MSTAAVIVAGVQKNVTIIVLHFCMAWGKKHTPKTFCPSNILKQKWNAK